MIKIFLLVLTLLALTVPVEAQEWVGKNYGKDLDEAAKGNVSALPWGANAGYGQMMTITCGIMPFFGPDACTNDRGRFASLIQKSAMYQVSTGIAVLYQNRPASFGPWLADTSQTLGFAPKKAYAQGIGFSGLSPLLPIWKGFRNIAYFVLAVVMVVIGFMVMLRKKIDPKTVVTVQNALPRIVMALILITFSYAIVGLMIDLMYVLIALGNAALRSSLEGTTLIDVIPQLLRGGFMELTVAVFGPFASITVLGPAAQTWQSLQQGQWLEAAKTAWEAILTDAFLFNPIMLFIFALAYIFAFVRIFLLLLNSYIQVIMAVLTGPLQILLDAIPGADGFSSWLKNLTANLLAFPVTIFMLFIGNALAFNFGRETLWVAPLLPQPSTIGSIDGQLGGGLGGLALVFINLGVVMTIPSVVNSIKEAIKAKSAIPSGPGVIFGPLAKGAGTVLQTGYQFSMVRGMFKSGSHEPGGGKKP